MQPDQDRLRAIYRRCDVSNNGITDTIGEDEFLALIAREVRQAKIDELKISADRFMPGWEKDWFNDRIAELSKEETQ